MTDKNGKIKIIEINPRMSGSLATSIIAGYPIIDNLLKLINKIKPDLSKPKKNILVIPYKTLYKKNEKMKKIAIFGNKKNYKKILVKFLKYNKKISFVFVDLEAKKLPQTLDDADAIIFFPRKLISNNFLKKRKN